MRVLVTGGAGYIGSVCVECLIDYGHSVLVYDNLCEGHRSAVSDKASFVFGNIADVELLKTTLTTFKPEAVIHFAASALVGESMQNPHKYFENNVTNALRLLETSRNCGVRKFVFSSTCATYGPPKQFPMTEDLPQNPVNPYGESKLMFERILKWYHEIYGIEFVAFRYFNAAGASPNFGEHHKIETHLIPNVLKVVLGQKPHCEIYGKDYPTPDGTCIRDYIHVIDLSIAHILALKDGICGFYNLGNGNGYSVLEVIKMCEEVTGVKIPTVVKERRPGDPPRLVASAEKAKRDLGWIPKLPELKEIIESAWKWHKDHPNGYPD
jgi:UDP-glucose 4-epimerase